MTEYPTLVLARVGYSALEYARGRERRQGLSTLKREREQKVMKIKDAIKYLSDYEDQEQEILIAWNDKEFIEDETVTDEVWDKAVWLFDKYCGEGFNDECRAVISQAEYDLREEKESE